MKSPTLLAYRQALVPSFWLTFAVILIASTTASAQIPASAYPARRAAALAAIGGNVLIVPARASFLADDQLGFTQAADFQYLTGLDDVVGAVLVLDGATSQSMLFVAPRSPLVTRGTVAAGAESASRLHLASVQPIDALEAWLRQRFTRTSSAYTSPQRTRVMPSPHRCRWRARSSAGRRGSHRSAPRK